MTMAASGKQYKVDATKKKADSAKGGSDHKSSEFRREAGADKIKETPSMLHLNVRAHKGMAGDSMKVGKSFKAHISGKIASIHHDEYGHRATVEVSSIDSPRGNASADSDTAGSLKKK